MYTSVSRRKKGFLFSLSLILHIGALLILLVSYHLEQVLLQKKNAPTSLYERAVILSQGNQHSATVIFQPPAAQQPTQASKASPSAPAAHAPASAQPAQQQMAAHATTQHVSDATQQQQQQPKTQPLEPSSDNTTTIIPKIMAQQAMRPEKASPTVQQPIQAAQLTPRATQSAARSAQQSTLSNRTATAQSTSNSKADDTPTVTMKDLAQGFLKSFENERGRKPDRELNSMEMAIQSYTTKVYSILKQSVACESKPLTMAKAISAPAEFVLVIDKTGKPLSCEFKHPLPSHELMPVEKILKRAALNTGLYPKFPRLIDKDTITISFPLNVEIQEGTHVYKLLYR